MPVATLRSFRCFWMLCISWRRDFQHLHMTEMVDWIGQHPERLKRSLQGSQWYSNGVQPKRLHQNRLVNQKIWETKKHFSQHRLQQLFFDKPLIVNSCSATAPAVRLVCRMRRSALRGKRKIRISSRAQKDTIMIQKNTQKDYGCHSNDSCVKILFAPINSPLEAMRHHVKHWSLLLLLSAVASGVFAFTKNFFHLVAFRCPFDLVPSGDFAYTVPVSLCAMTKWCCPQQLLLQP